MMCRPSIKVRLSLAVSPFTSSYSRPVSDGDGSGAVSKRSSPHSCCLFVPGSDISRPGFPWQRLDTWGGDDQLIGIGLSSLALKWPVQGLLTVALMALILWVAGRHRARPSEAIILSLVGAVLLGVLSDPGILLALGIMVLGYATHRPQHSLLGLLFAIGFGWHFYYALELTLLQKSLTLVTSGMLLLAAAAYMHRRGWAAPNRELANE